MTTSNPSVTQPLQPVGDDKNLLAAPQDNACACGGCGCN